MPKPGPRTTYRYSPEFKSTAIRLSQLPGVAVQDVAQSLYIHLNRPGFRQLEYGCFKT